MSENPYSGQGPVLLDIGGNIGALVVEMPAELEGVEVEIKPAGDEPPDRESVDQAHENHGHAHNHDHVPAKHVDDDDHVHIHVPARLHVAVVVRTAGSRDVPSLVFPELVEGHYELYRKDGGPVELTATIVGGEVTSAVWPR
jgi:hypothetical protein